MKLPIITAFSFLIVLLTWAGPSAAQHAEYTVLLKNGSRITVKGYREEGEMLRVQGLGGEFGIPKDQVVSITKGAARSEKGLVLPGYNSRSEEGSPQSGYGEGESAPGDNTGAEAKKAGPSEKNEEKEYRRRIREVTDSLNDMQQRYSMAARGRTGPEPGLLEGEEAIQSRTADLQSRLKDAQREAGRGSTKVDAPLPSYTPQERELSDMRKEILRLQEQRDQLIQEMKQKNFSTDDLSSSN